MLGSGGFSGAASTLYITHPDRGKESNEELTEDLIGLVRAYLK